MQPRTSKGITDLLLNADSSQVSKHCKKVLPSYLQYYHFPQWKFNIPSARLLLTPTRLNISYSLLPITLSGLPSSQRSREKHEKKTETKLINTHKEHHALQLHGGQLQTSFTVRTRPTHTSCMHRSLLQSNSVHKDNVETLSLLYDTSAGKER